MPNHSDFPMPGPQFGNNQNGAGWLSRHYRKIVFTLIIALLAIGAGYFYQNYQARTALLRPTLEGITASPTPTSSNAPNKQKTSTNNEIEDAINPTPEVKQVGQDIVATATKGNGVTHLARQALKKYLKNKPELTQKLEAEQRIYIEDYLRKHLTNQPKILRVGDQITFSDNDIQNAIDKALTLNDGQIKNLNQYVPLVPSLMTP